MLNNGIINYSSKKADKKLKISLNGYGQLEVT